MHIVVIILHVLACIGLILIVLLQRGKGADLGAAFGGSSQTVFGSQGAGGFLTKVTTAAAVVFMFTSLGLAYLSSHRVQATVMGGKEPTQQVEEPAASNEEPEASDEAPSNVSPPEQKGGPETPETAPDQK